MTESRVADTRGPRKTQELSRLIHEGYVRTYHPDAYDRIMESRLNGDVTSVVILYCVLPLTEILTVLVVYILSNSYAGLQLDRSHGLQVSLLLVIAAAFLLFAIARGIKRIRYLFKLSSGFATLLIEDCVHSNPQRRDTFLERLYMSQQTNWLINKVNRNEYWATIPKGRVTR